MLLCFWMGAHSSASQVVFPHLDFFFPAWGFPAHVDPSFHLRIEMPRLKPNLAEPLPV